MEVTYQIAKENVLRDDCTATGGTAFNGETLADFMEDAGIPYGTDTEAVDAALKECGIMPVGFRIMFNETKDRIVDTKFILKTLAYYYCDEYESRRDAVAARLSLAYPRLKIVTEWWETLQYTPFAESIRTEYGEFKVDCVEAAAAEVFDRLSKEENEKNI